MEKLFIGEDGGPRKNPILKRPLIRSRHAKEEKRAGLPLATMGRCLLFLLLLLAGSISVLMAGPRTQSITVTAATMNLNRDAPEQQTFGKLQFLNGFELASKDSRFGGLSGLTLSQDGQMLYAISDRGYWFSAGLKHDAEGRLTDMGKWTVGPLLAINGKVLNSRERDAEALTQDQDGSFIVAFERLPRLWRYPASSSPFSQPPVSLPLPPEIHQAPANGGLEGATILNDRRLLLITERFKNKDGSVKSWLVDKSLFTSLSYPITEDFLPTDLATLPNGDILLLERQYKILRGAIVRIRRIPRESIRAKAQLTGKEIIRLAPPLEVDNFEGMALHQDAQGRVLLYLVSDDNYSPLQRTLLFQFRLIDN